MSRAAPSRQPAYVWDAAARRYRGPSGRLLAERALRRAVEAQVEAARVEMRRHAEDLIAARINRSEWMLRMEASVKRAHVITGVAAMGGREQVAISDLGWIGQRVREQYERLRAFGRDVEAGRLSDAQLLARSDLYAEAARATHREAERRRERLAGMTEERRVLSPADHCSTRGGLRGCVELARLGWQPAGSLPRIGQTPCKVRCKCVMQFRRTEER